MKIKVNVKDELADLIERYFAVSGETYDTLMEAIIRSRLDVTSAADLTT